MSTRTLINWRAASLEGASRSPGRPPHPVLECRRALWAVARCVQRLGWVGWRKIDKDLAGDVPVCLVQKSLSGLKQRRRAVLRRRAERERVHVEVLYRDAVWSQDATHLGRCPREAERACAEPMQGHVSSPEPGVSQTKSGLLDAPRPRARRALVPVLGEVLRDVASTRTLDLAVGGPATGEEVVAGLERARVGRGGLALVWCTDNGSQYVCKHVAAWLARHQVVHLKSLPHTPKHNPWVERGHRDLKEDAELGKGVVLESAAAAARLLARSRERIDEHPPRATRGQRTAAECDAQNTPWYPAVRRECFYERYASGGSMPAERRRPGSSLVTRAAPAAASAVRP